MSELLAQAAAALNAPEAIVKRSAEARAKAGGISTDEVLAAWAGGDAVTTAAPAPAAPAPVAAAVETPVEESPTVMAVEEAPVASVAIADPLVVEKVEVPEPVALGDRIKTAGRIGAWTGSLLGLLGALIASPWLLTAASLSGSEGQLQSVGPRDRIPLRSGNRVCFRWSSG